MGGWFVDLQAASFFLSPTPPTPKDTRLLTFPSPPPFFPPPPPPPPPPRVMCRARAGRSLAGFRPGLFIQTAKVLSGSLAMKWWAYL